MPPQAASTLFLVACGTDKLHPATFTVRYQDGTTRETALTVSNWLGVPAAGEPVMLCTRFLRTAKGDDWTRRGSLYVYRIPLDRARIPQALLLPNAPDVCVFAVTLDTTAK